MQFGQTPIDFTELPLQEEIANAITHGLGLVLSFCGAVAMLAAAGSLESELAMGCGIYALSLVVVYSVSTLSHAVQQPQAKHVLRVWDQGVIYLLIAGTYTPFACWYLPSNARWLVLSGLWGFALVGLLSKVVLQYRVMNFKAHSYVMFGWIPALTMIHLVSLACLTWMALGGLAYTLGTLFLRLDRKYRFFHATWHLFVITGSACHYYAIMTFVVLRPPPV